MCVCVCERERETSVREKISCFTHSVLQFRYLFWICCYSGLDQFWISFCRRFHIKHLFVSDLIAGHDPLTFDLWPAACWFRSLSPTHTVQTSNCLIRPLCCFLSDPFGRKVALNTPLRRAASSTVACTFCACARCNKWVALVWVVNKAYARDSLYFRLFHPEQT